MCGPCLDRFVWGERPPWQPDAIARRANMLKLAFQPKGMPVSATENMAEFLEEWFMP